MNTIKLYLETLKIRNANLLFCSMLLYSLTFYTTVFTLFLLKRGLSYWEIFFLESVLSFAIFVFEVPSGVLADRFGRKKLIVTSVCLFAVSTYIIALSHSVAWFIFESFLYGIGVAAMSGADSALIYDTLIVRNKTGLAKYAFSLIGMVESFAMVVSLPIGGWLGALQISLPVYITCIPLTIAILPVLFLKEMKNEKDGQIKKKRMKWHAVSTVKTVLIKYPRLVILQCLFSVVFGAVFSLTYLNQPFFKAYGIPIRHFGWIMLIIHLIMTAAILFIPWIRGKLGIKGIFFMTTFIPGIMFLVLFMQPNKTAGVAFLGLILIVNSLRGPVNQTFINEQIGETERASILSILSFSGSVIGMGFKPIIGVLADMGLPFTFLIFGILLTVISFLIVIVVPNTRKSI